MTYSLTPRALDIPTPYLFRRGVTQTISAPVRYGSGAPLVSPVEAESSITITKPDGTSFTSGAAVTVASSTATYDFTSTASEVLDEGWVVEWSLVFSSGDDAEVYRHTGILVEYSLFPVISARDVFIEEPELEFKVPQQQGEQGTDEGWQPQIDAAWHSVVRRLIERGDVVPADALPVSGIEHHRHAGAGHTLRGDLPTREPLRAQPKHELRLDLAYHPNHSFCRVISHTAEGA